jgi:hypothetical protein
MIERKRGKGERIERVRSNKGKGQPHCFGRPCTIIRRGPEQSEVKLSNGLLRFVVNEWITSPRDSVTGYPIWEEYFR